MGGGSLPQLALLNIGLVIFGGVYAFVPQLTGREWYSHRLADWHLALTVVGGYGSVVPWMLQAVEGAPRRWAVLPDRVSDADPARAPPRRSDRARPARVRVQPGADPGPAVAGAHHRPATEGRRGRVAGGAPLARVGRRPGRTEGIALSFYCLWFKPFLWAPIGVLLGYCGVALGARRQGAAAMLISIGLLGAALLLRL